MDSTTAVAVIGKTALPKVPVKEDMRVTYRNP